MALNPSEIHRRDCLTQQNAVANVDLPCNCEELEERDESEREDRAYDDRRDGEIMGVEW